MNVAKTVLALLLTQAAAGSAITVILLAFRRIFKKHVRPGLIYGAWLLVALRLLLPLSLSNPLLPSATDMQSPSIKVPSAMVQTVAQDTTPPSPLAFRQEAVMTDPVSAPIHSLSTESLLLLLWGSGVLLTAVFMVMLNRKLIKSAQLRAIDLPGARYPVYLSSLPSPCVLKVFRPMIALNEKSMQPENLRYALYHETCHLRRGDLIWALLRNVLCALYWFCPFVWLAAAVSRRDCELSCDDKVKRSLSGDERFEYAQTLLRLAGKPLPFPAAAMSNTKRDLKERLEYIMSSHLPKRCVSVYISVLLCFTCLFSFATAGGTSLPIEPTQPTASLQANASETVPPADEYTKRAWSMDEINYNDLQMSMDVRVKDKQIYMCTGTITALIGSDPQLVTMKLRGSSLYVVLENATGKDWEVGSAYKVFAEAAGKHTDMPEVTTLIRIDYMPRLVARYSYVDTDYYSINELQNKLDDLERRFGSGSANAAVFRDRLNSFDPDDLCMMNFVKKLMETDTAGEYDALLHTRFPGINEAFPGYESMPVVYVRTLVDSILRNAMGVDLSKYPWRYEACIAPGLFDIRLGEDSRQIRYYVQMHSNASVSIDTIPTTEELDSQTILAVDQIPDETLQKAMDTARNFAGHLFFPTGKDSVDGVITPSKEPLAKGRTAGKMPVQFNLLYPDEGIGYQITVDIDTMRIMQAFTGYMEIDKDGFVVPKVD